MDQPAPPETALTANKSEPREAAVSLGHLPAYCTWALQVTFTLCPSLSDRASAKFLGKPYHKHQSAWLGPVPLSSHWILSLVFRVLQAETLINCVDTHRPNWHWLTLVLTLDLQEWTFLKPTLIQVRSRQPSSAHPPIPNHPQAGPGLLVCLTPCPSSSHSPKQEPHDTHPVVNSPSRDSQH